VLPEIDGGNSKAFAEKIRQLVEKQDFRFENTRIQVTISMGVGAIDDDHADAATLIKQADDYLYAAKSAGRNQVCAA